VKRLELLLLGALLASATACARDARPEHPRQPEREACSDAALLEIDAEYVREALETCRGQEASECEALPGIRGKYARKRDAWQECQ
jgi:hypothetical protein